MSDFTPEQVERAAEVFVRFPTGLHMYWHPLSDLTAQDRRNLARAVLSAAGAPEKVAPTVDEAALERLIMGRTATAAAREVAAYLRGESK